MPHVIIEKAFYKNAEGFGMCRRQQHGFLKLNGLQKNSVDKNKKRRENKKKFAYEKQLPAQYY